MEVILVNYNTAEKHPEESTIFPSEQVGFVVHHKTIYEAWLEVLFHIERFGECHESGARTKRLRAFTWIAEDETEGVPDCSSIPEALQKNLSITPDVILEYVKEHFLRYGGTRGDGCTYGNRLCRWGGIFNQVDAAITTLQKSPNTRRVFLSTLMPSRDLLEQRQPPCLVGIQFLKDSTENLDAIAIFRSHDIFGAGLRNAFGILYLLRYVAREVNMQRGRIIITSHDAHIYMQDSKDVRQVLQSAWGSNPAATSKPNIGPRGSFLIHLADSKIVVDCINNTGNLLQQFSGTDASAIYQEVARYRLISQPEHGCYLGVQLARAEECLRRNLPFTQDQPISE